MEKLVWDVLKKEGFNDFGVAGLMGNLYAESGLKPNNLQNTYQKKLGFTDESYTKAIDNNTYKNFVRDSAGYGLAQWTHWSRKEKLLNFAKAKNKSIGDLQMQLDFLIHELKTAYSDSVYEKLKNAPSVLEASNIVLMKFERPANMGLSVQLLRAKYGESFYNKYSERNKKKKEEKMNILIGHSAIDENGKARGGKSGDQTKKEVCKREWYKASWDVLLRCNDPVMAEKMAVACEQACDNDNIGYDQNQRNSLNIEAKKVRYDLSKITTKCECDCSSLMCVCAIAAGIPESALYQGGNMRTTRNMRSAFKATGKFEVLTDSKYLTSDTYLKRGDILVNEGSHTIMVLGNGAQAPKEPVPEQVKPSNNTVIGTAITKGSINVRTGPSTSYKAVGIVKKGTEVKVLDITSNNWYKIVWPSTAEGYAYVSNASNKYFDYTSINKELTESVAPSASFKVSITANSLYVRTGPGTKYKAKTVIHKGENYEIVEEVVDNRNVKWGLLKQYSANRDGWISMRYAQKI